MGIASHWQMWPPLEVCTPTSHPVTVGVYHDDKHHDDALLRVSLPD